MNERLRKVLDTGLGGTTDRSIIETAVSSYLNTLHDIAYGMPWEPMLNFSEDQKGIQEKLHTIYSTRVEEITPFVSEIILDINERIKVWESEEYKVLIERDNEMWHAEEYPLQFSLFACVDKGIPFEAVIGVTGDINRTLGGDIDIEYSPSRNTFFQDYTSLKKGLIHERRVIEGADVIVLLEHFGCGRRHQIVGNEEEENEIPKMGFVFDHIDALTSEIGGNGETLKKLNEIKTVWQQYDRIGPAIITPDDGLYAGIVYKMAQRIAIKNTTKNPKTIVPIVAYDKMNGNFVTGLDNIDVLTDPIVLSEGGFTEKALQTLVRQGKIFSLEKHKNEIDLIIETVGQNNVPQKRTYTELQNDWLDVQTELVDLTEMLWCGANNQSKQSRVFQGVINNFIEHVLPPGTEHNVEAFELQAIINRLTHLLFHVTSYAYHLETLEKGNDPGNHVEDHVAAGNHDLGTRRHLPLGQGFLQKPTALELYTGYFVVKHSIPGKGDGFAIPVMIKCDTDKETDQSISIPETRVTLEDFRTFMDLWAYFLVGELIPFVVIKQTDGGISRLAKSIELTFDDMARGLESKKINLPMFVPAATHEGKVVLVPAREVLITGVNTGGSLKKFRDAMEKVAEHYAPDDYQDAFKRANASKRK